MWFIKWMTNIIQLNIYINIFVYFGKPLHLFYKAIHDDIDIYDTDWLKWPFNNNKTLNK